MLKKFLFIFLFVFLINSVFIAAQSEGVLINTNVSVASDESGVVIIPPSGGSSGATNFSNYNITDRALIGTTTSQGFVCLFQNATTINNSVIFQNTTKLDVRTSINVSSGKDICITGGNCLSSVSAGSGNSSWNQSFANTLYSPLGSQGDRALIGSSATQGYIPQWQNGTTLNNSIIYQNGTTVVTIGSNLLTTTYAHILSGVFYIGQNDGVLLQAGTRLAVLSPVTGLTADIVAKKLYLGGTGGQPQAQLHVNSSSSSTPVVIAQGAVSQSANLFEARNSSESVLVSIKPNGDILGPTASTWSIDAATGGGININSDWTFDLTTHGFYPTSNYGKTLGLTNRRIGDSYFGRVDMTAKDATDVPLKIKANATQTANLQEWQNSSGTALTVVNANGSLGVGTANPTQTATFNGGINFLNSNDAFLTSNNVIGLHSNGYMYLQGGTNGFITAGNNGRTQQVMVDAITDSVQFIAGAIEQMRITGAGNAGLGTMSPQSKLEINNTNASQPVARLKGASGQTANLQEWQTSTGVVQMAVDSSGQLISGTASTSTGGFQTGIGGRGIGLGTTSSAYNEISSAGSIFFKPGTNDNIYFKGSGTGTGKGFLFVDVVNNDLGSVNVPNNSNMEFYLTNVSHNYTFAKGNFTIDNYGNVLAKGNLNVSSGEDICITGGNCLSKVPSGIMFNNFTDQANSVTDETNLYVYSLAANTLTATGDSAIIEFAATYIGSTSTKQFKTYSSQNNSFDSGAVSLGTGGTVQLRQRIIRINATAAEIETSLQSTQATTFNYANHYELVNVNFASAMQLNITGTAGGVGAASADITARSFVINKVSGA